MLHLQTRRLIQYPGTCRVLCKKRFQSSPVCERLRHLRQSSASPYCSSCPPPPLSFPYRAPPLIVNYPPPSCPILCILVSYTNYFYVSLTTSIYVGVGLRPDLVPHSCVFSILLPTVPPLNSLTLPPKHLACAVPLTPSSLLPQRPSTSSSAAAATPPPVCL